MRLLGHFSLQNPLLFPLQKRKKMPKRRRVSSGVECIEDQSDNLAIDWVTTNNKPIH